MTDVGHLGVDIIVLYCINMFVNVPGIVIVTCGFINHDEIDNALNVDVVVDHLTKE